jgi:hypothetical protein
MSSFDGMVPDGDGVEDVVAGAGVAVVAGVVVCASTTVAEDRAKKAAAVTRSSLLVMGISFCLKAIHVQVANLIPRRAFFLNDGRQPIRRWLKQILQARLVVFYPIANEWWSINL